MKRIAKTNPASVVALRDNIFKSISQRVKGYNPTEGAENIPYYFAGYKPRQVIRLSKRIIENAALVNIDTLSDLVQLDMKYSDIAILYPHDATAYVRKIGQEIAFICIDFTVRPFDMDFGSFNFITKSFFPERNMEEKEALLRLLIYLFYGDVTWRLMEPKAKLKAGASTFTEIHNDTDLKIWYANSLWKQRISVSGFKVSGHFRLQPFGRARLKRKLIWIEQFEKHGYNRKATRELMNKAEEG